MILVVGGLGNMGKRYCSILRMLHLEHESIDEREPEFSSERFSEAAGRATEIILATPTYDHVRTMRSLNDHVKQKVSLLCEKPVTKKLEEFDELKTFRNLKIFCVNQYAYLPEYNYFRKAEGRTHYNYFKHGDDGLAWDCFQLFGLSTGMVTLNDSSPIWKCRINGVEINSAGMDFAYIQMVQDFLGPKRRSWDLFASELVSIKVQKWIVEEQILG